MNKYNILKNNCFKSGNYCIVPLRMSDIFKIKNWRNEQVSILRQNSILTESDQEKYYNNFVLPCFTSTTPNIILFSFIEDDACIGYGGFVHINFENRRAEMSFLLDTQRGADFYQYEKDFSVFISLMKIIAFEDLNFNKIHTETYETRFEHISILEKNGFVLEGSLRQHVFKDETFINSLLHSCLKEEYHA